MYPVISLLVLSCILIRPNLSKQCTTDCCSTNILKITLLIKIFSCLSEILECRFDIDLIKDKKSAVGKVYVLCKIIGCVSMTNDACHIW